MKVNHIVQDWIDFKRHILSCKAGMVMVDINNTTTNIFGCKTLIWGLYVNELHRGKGIGKHLLDKAEAIARENGQEIVVLEWELPTPQWVFDWYIRCGYDEREFGRDFATLYKTLIVRKNEL